MKTDRYNNPRARGQRGRGHRIVNKIDVTDARVRSVVFRGRKALNSKLNTK